MYPGGDYEVFRPSWKRHEVDFGGRKGYVKLAREAGVPIVPIASVGGQEAALFLDRGQWLARLLEVDKMARLKSVPILLAPPWGLAVSDMVPRLPLPTKIAIEVQDPIDADDIAASDDDVINDKVLGQPAGRGRPAGRGTTIPGDRLMSACRRRQLRQIDADRDTVWKRVSDPACYPEFMANLERWDPVTEGPSASVALHRALEDRLGAGGRRDRGGRVRRRPRPGLDRHHRDNAARSVPAAGLPRRPDQGDLPDGLRSARWHARPDRRLGFGTSGRSDHDGDAGEPASLAEA